MFLAIPTILALYNVKKAAAPDGKEIIPEVGMVSGIARSVTHLSMMYLTEFQRNDAYDQSHEAIQVCL